MVFIFTLMYKYIINVFEKTKEILFYVEKNTNDIKTQNEKNTNEIKINLNEIKTQNENLGKKMIEMENNIKKIYFENELIKKYLFIEEKIYNLNDQVNNILDKNKIKNNNYQIN